MGVKYGRLPGKTGVLTGMTESLLSEQHYTQVRGSLLQFLVNL